MRDASAQQLALKVDEVLLAPRGQDHRVGVLGEVARAGLPCRVHDLRAENTAGEVLPRNDVVGQRARRTGLEPATAEVITLGALPLSFRRSVVEEPAECLDGLPPDPLCLALLAGPTLVGLTVNASACSGTG